MDENKIEINPFTQDASDFFWCLHCEVVYPASEWAKDEFNCPDPECDGMAHDAVGWHDYHTQAIEKPIVGKRYQSNLVLGAGRD